jgi:hypothetical protein
VEKAPAFMNRLKCDPRHPGVRVPRYDELHYFGTAGAAHRKSPGTSSDVKVNHVETPELSPGASSCVKIVGEGRIRWSTPTAGSWMNKRSSPTEDGGAVKGRDLYHVPA